MKTWQGAARAPFNAVLGSEANVRILRVLTRTRNSIGRAEAARRAGITPQGGRKALARLVENGIVELVGSGSAQQVTLNFRHPLARPLSNLFRAERKRFDRFLMAVQAAVNLLDPAPLAAWGEGPVADGTDEFGDPLVLSVLAGTRQVEQVSEKLRDLVAPLEAKFDITIEVRGLTMADLASGPLRERGTFLPIWGPEPSALMGDRPSKQQAIHSHGDLDRRSRERAQKISELLTTDPSLRERALQHVREQLNHVSSGERKELREWQRILESMSLARLRTFLSSDSERAVRLRQSLPFWSILREDERAILARKIDRGSGE